MSNETRPYRILIATGEQSHMQALLAIAMPLARSRQGHVIPLYVGTDDAPPAWLSRTSDQLDVVEPPSYVQSANTGRGILRAARELAPDLLLLLWKGTPSRGRYLLGVTLDPVIQQAPCDVGVVRVGPDPSAFAERMKNIQRVLVPSSGGPNADLALALGLDLGPEVRVTALRVARQPLGPTALSAQWEMLRTAVSKWQSEPRLERHVTLATGISSGILQEAEQGYDLVFLGATRESLVDRVLFGNLPQMLAQQIQQPVVVVRRHDPAPAATLRRARWRLLTILPQLSLKERIGIYRSVRRSARTTTDFYVMMVLAAALASLGLLANSPAVIIGAMLVAPLMSSLVGVGLAIVQGDSTLLRLSMRTLVIGVLLVVAVSALVGALVPSSTITGEMQSRSSPTLLDLAVALVSGAAAAYALGRDDVSGALPGVAIAVALVPPLATIGLGAVALDPRVTLGATLLFLTNLVAIVAAVAIVFLWMGFHPDIREELRARTFRGGLLSTGVLLVAIAALLGILTIASVRQVGERRAVQNALERQVEQMGTEVKLGNWELKTPTGEARLVHVTLESARPISQVEVATLANNLRAFLDQAVEVDVTLVAVEHLSADAP